MNASDELIERLVREIVSLRERVSALETKDAGIVNADISASAAIAQSKISNASPTINADRVDGYHAGNASGQVPVSNGTVCTNLNADMVDGYHAGNASGQVPVSNGTVCTNLNADKVDGYDAATSGANAHVVATDASGNATISGGLNVGSATGAGAGDINASGRLTLGSSPAASGLIRLPNNQWIAARNQANNADVNLISLNPSNRVALGQVEALNVGIDTGASTGNANISGSVRIGSALAVDYHNVSTDSWGVMLYQGDGTNPRTSYAYLDMEGTNRLRVVGKIGGGSETVWAYINSTSGWQAASSRKVKDNITPLAETDYADLRRQLRNTEVYSYMRRDVPDAPEIGLIAEEAPRLMLATNSNEAINYLRAIGFLLAVVKAHETEIESLKARLWTANQGNQAHA